MLSAEARSGSLIGVDQQTGSTQAYPPILVYLEPEDHPADTSAVGEKQVPRITVAHVVDFYLGSLRPPAA